MDEVSKKYSIYRYSPLEESLNVWSHFIGGILSCIALVFLIIRGIELQNIWTAISFPIFGLSMITLYLASTLYHHAKSPKIRYRLNIFDHASIYLLIAGSYTPFVMVTLNGTTGWVIFFVIWSLALVGIIFKIFFTGRFNILSTILYVAMGWLIIFSFKSLAQNLDFSGLMWLVAGGVAYTIGAVLYSIDKLKLNHAIFHIFVLLGTFCHFISVYFYVVPVS